jgi:hypothetical protein
MFCANCLTEVFWLASSDMFNDGQRNLNFPKVYVGKWHHSVHYDQNQKADKDFCAQVGSDEFRANDWYLFDPNIETLTPGDVIPGKS